MIKKKYVVYGQSHKLSPTTTLFLQIQIHKHTHKPHFMQKQKIKSLNIYWNLNI